MLVLCHTHSSHANIILPEPRSYKYRYTRIYIPLSKYTTVLSSILLFICMPIREGGSRDSACSRGQQGGEQGG